MTTSALLSALRGPGRRKITASTVAARQATGSHVFRMEGFTRLREKAADGAAVLSSPFAVGGHDWRVECFPNGEGEDDVDAKAGTEKKVDGDCISLFLQHVSPAPASATAEYKISILDESWKPSITVIHDEDCFSGDECSWGIDMELDREQHLQDDCLSVLCDVTVDLGLRTEEYAGEAAAAEELRSAPPAFDLRGFALAEALWNAKSPDVMIHLGDGDGQTIAAHGWVLEARSPVFKADLAVACTTGESIAELRVDGMDADVCKALLRFIYTDSPPPQLEAAPPTTAQKLLAAADRYELEKLKLACEEALCKKIDASSVAAALAVAERHGCPALRKACMQFLSSRGNLKAVVASDGLEQLKTGCPSAVLELVEKNMTIDAAAVAASAAN